MSHTAKEECWMNLQPLGDRLIVEALEEEETTVSGIVLPDPAKEKPQRGRVLAVGPAPRDEDGEYMKMELEKGDELIFSNDDGDGARAGHRPRGPQERRSGRQPDGPQARHRRCGRRRCRGPEEAVQGD